MTETFTITLPWWIAALFAAAAALSVVSDALRIYIMRLERRLSQEKDDDCKMIAVPPCFIRLVEAARGLRHGTDWNNGTHAKLHGYRQKLLDALNECDTFLRETAQPAASAEPVAAVVREHDGRAFAVLRPAGENLPDGTELYTAIGAAQAQPKRRPYNTSGSLSEYGILPECDAAPAAQAPRACTCHPDDRPDGPCRERYAASECQALAAQAPAANGDALDAARYRWLRDPCSGAERVIFYCRGDYGRGLMSSAMLDAAIDAAIAAEKKEG